jgi:uncharacterized membrane protein YqjE
VETPETTESSGASTSRIDQDAAETPTLTPAPDGRKPPSEQSLAQLVRSIATDTSTLVRKEIELARLELTESLTARIKAAAALAVAGVLGLLAVVFLGAALAAALDLVMPRWASRLVVAGVFLLITGAAAAFGLRRMKKPPLAPTETKRTVKEDVEWAKTQLKR